MTKLFLSAASWLLELVAAIWNIACVGAGFVVTVDLFSEAFHTGF
jgi:hypothetical protein